MAKVTVTAEAPSGEKFTREIEDTEIPTYRKKTEDMKYKFSVSAPLTEEESKKVESGVLQQTSMREAALGGLLQGLSLGTEDVIGEDTEALRQRQEAEHPYVYGGAKFLGSLVPTIGAAGAGAAAGAAAGAPFGGVGAIPGAVIGGTLGGMAGAGLAGGIESYASKPTPEGGKKLETSDVGMGLLSAAGEGVGKALAPAARGVYRTIRGKLLPEGTTVLKGTTELAEENISKIASEVNAWKKLRQRVMSNKLFTEKEDDFLKMTDNEIWDVSDSSFDAEKSIKLRNDLNRAIADYGGTDIGSVDAAMEVLGKQLADAQNIIAATGAGAVTGGTVAAVPGAVLGAKPTEAEIIELNRQAAARAYEEAQRRKTERVMAEAEAEAAIRSGVEERNIERMKRIAPKKKR